MIIVLTYKIMRNNFLFKTSINFLHYKKIKKIKNKIFEKDNSIINLFIMQFCIIFIIYYKLYYYIFYNKTEDQCSITWLNNYKQSSMMYNNIVKNKIIL